MKDDVGKKHCSSKEEIEAEIEPKFEVIVVRWMSQMIAFHQVVGAV